MLNIVRPQGNSNQGNKGYTSHARVSMIEVTENDQCW